MDETSNTFMLSSKTYDFFKKLVQIVIPAFSSLYFGLASVWGLPASDQVVGTSAILATFLGVILGISTKQYQNSEAMFDGSIVITESESGRKLFSLELDGDPEELEKQGSISFKVAKQAPDVAGRDILAEVPQPD